MAKPLKEAGVKELEGFRKRVRRQHSLGRITNESHALLERKVNDLITYINIMPEAGSDGH